MVIEKQETDGRSLTERQRRAGFSGLVSWGL